jgi:hypothetical protein
VNRDLSCGSCGSPLNEMRAACAICGREADAIRHDIEQRAEQLLQLRAALLRSTHINAAYELALIEQELRSYGIDPSSASGQALPSGRLDNASAAVGDSAVSSTAPTLGELERLPPNKGGCSEGRTGPRPRRGRAFLPLKDGWGGMSRAKTVQRGYGAAHKNSGRVGSRWWTRAR